MCNLAAEIFRIEKSDTLRASIPPFVSFLRWTSKAGPEQDSLKRAVKVWFSRAQKPAKILDENDAVHEMAPEEIEPMLSERIEKWSNDLIRQGRTEGKAEGKIEGKIEGQTEGIQNVARNMLKKGMSVSEIADLTGLSEQKILALVDGTSR